MRHQNLISKMTLEEKAAFLSGKNEWQSRDIPRLCIPSVFCSDGPHGVRKQVGAGDHLGQNPSLPSTCFPTAATVANSWNQELGESLGKALGEEAQELGVHILLGPGLNIKRSPLCGRNFEYFSEDPYLSGKMAASYIRGIQSQGVFACPKHFAVNSQELRRMVTNSVVDERTLRELYLTGFEIAVKEGKAKSIMTSYNEVNGTYANENKHLLQDILRKEWGFDGIVITDWGGSNDHVEGVKAGSNLEMPSPGFDSARQLQKALEDGRLTEQELDQRIDELLDAALLLNGNISYEKSGETFCSKEINAKRNRSQETQGQDAKIGTKMREAHHALALWAAQESMVLLKNEDSILPLASGARTAIIGDFALAPRYQGAGSSLVNPLRLDTAAKMADESGLQIVGICKGYRRDGKMDESLKEEAVKLAAGAAMVLYFFGLNENSESEGMDRLHMRIPENQIEVLAAIAEVNPRVIGILSGGSAVEMTWQGCCKAILHGYLNGQAGARAVFDVVTGRVNPSGKLSETYPVRYEDTPAFYQFPSKERSAEYRESLYVGYRYYDTAGVRVQYPFGYGLSYTSFTYSDLIVKNDGVTFTLTNSGEADGAEIVQMYISLPGAKVFRPAKELKGFTKVRLRSGESRRVKMPFDDKTFRFWNVRTDRWECESGTYRVLVGAGSGDIRLTGEYEIAGNMTECPYRKEELPFYYSGHIQKVEDTEFEKLLGHPIPYGKWGDELGLNDAICQMGHAKSALARLVYRILTHLKEKSEKRGKPDLNILFIYNMPFRGIAKMTEGVVSMEMAEGMVQAVNGHVLKGLGKVIRGFFANRRANRAYEKKLEIKK